MQRQGVEVKKELSNEEGSQSSDLREADPVDPLASSPRSKNSNSTHSKRQPANTSMSLCTLGWHFVSQRVAEAPD